MGTIGGPASNVLTPNVRLPLVDKQGMLTIPGQQILQQHAVLLNGSVPAVPSTATHASNVYTLQPYQVSPQFGNYNNFQNFPFMAPATSTGLVTATVVPPTGALATLPVLKNNGAAQATSGDIVNGRLYNLVFHAELNSGNGAFVLS